MAALVLTAAPGTARLNITTLLGEIEVSTVFRVSFHNKVSQPEIGKLVHKDLHRRAFIKDS